MREFYYKVSDKDTKVMTFCLFMSKVDLSNENVVVTS